MNTRFQIRDLSDNSRDRSLSNLSRSARSQTRKKAQEENGFRGGGGGV